MIKHTPLLLLILCSTLLTACSDNNDKQPDTIYQNQRDALEKARTVEDTLLKSHQQQREASDTQSR